MSDAKKIRERIEAACLSEMELLPEVAQDVSFHMTDWLDDLRRYVDFCNSPDAYSTEQAGEIIMGFLLHVPNHVAAAAKLYADVGVSDIFEVGQFNRRGRLMPNPSFNRTPYGAA